MIEYTEKKRFKPEDIDYIFHVARAPEAHYRSRIFKSLMNSPTVYTAWDDKRLVGLVRALDDTEMVAYVKTLVIDPEYEGQGIEEELLRHIAEKYKNFLYIDVVTDKRISPELLEKAGFHEKKDCIPEEIRNDAPYMMY